MKSTLDPFLPEKPEDVDRLMKLQQDVQHHYGFIPNLDDPVYNPPKEKLTILWVKIKCSRFGSDNDQQNVAEIIEEFKADPECDGDHGVDGCAVDGHCPQIPDSLLEDDVVSRAVVHSDFQRKPPSENKENSNFNAAR